MGTKTIIFDCLEDVDLAFKRPIEIMCRHELRDPFRCDAMR